MTMGTNHKTLQHKSKWVVQFYKYICSFICFISGFNTPVIDSLYVWNVLSCSCAMSFIIKNWTFFFFVVIASNISSCLKGIAMPRMRGLQLLSNWSLHYTKFSRALSQSRLVTKRSERTKKKKELFLWKKTFDVFFPLFRQLITYFTNWLLALSLFCETVSSWSTLWHDKTSSLNVAILYSQ